jgi:hypothetical protein
MVSILNLFFPSLQRTRLATLVDRVAARSQNAVHARVKDRLPAMNVHQARGYVRARAAAVLEREMGIVVAEVPGLTDADRSSILEAARQRVIRRLMLENVRLQQLGEPRTRRLAA